MSRFVGVYGSYLLDFVLVYKCIGEISSVFVFLRCQFAATFNQVIHFSIIVQEEKVSCMLFGKDNISTLQKIKKVLTKHMVSYKKNCFYQIKRVIVWSNLRKEC
jgi:hypothetical protein